MARSLKVNLDALEKRFAEIELTFAQFRKRGRFLPLSKAETRQAKVKHAQLKKRVTKAQLDKLKKLYQPSYAKLDAELTKLLVQHTLQDVLEALKRIATQQVNLYKDAPTGVHSLPKSKWSLAHTILLQADSALYARHCGDVRPRKKL